MRGSTHATIGIWGALNLAQALGQPLIGPVAFAYLGALWPDIDHPDSIVGRYFRFFYFAFGCFFGCQPFLPTLIFFAACAGVFTVIIRLRGLPLCGAAGLCWFLAADWLLWKIVFLRCPGLKDFFHSLFAHRGFSHSLLGLLAFAAPWFLFLTLLRLPLLWGAYFGVGYLLHVAADLLCNAGVPLFWPFAKHRVGLPLFRTRGVREMLLQAIVVWAVVSQVLFLARHGLAERLSQEFQWLKAYFLG